MTILESLNYSGILIGFATFMTIGIFHPIVIKAEYYFGRKSAWAFLINGLLFILLSLITNNANLSILFGVIAFSSLWGIHEVHQQHERVRKGWFPMNPKRKHDYE